MGGKRRPGLTWERKMGFPVAGVDEVGRGCLAGPVVAAAAVLPENPRAPWLKEIRDSKELSPEKRTELAECLRGWLLGFAIAEASVEEIDSINILQASHLAMKRAVEQIQPNPCHVLVDGHLLPKDWDFPATAIVQGDSKSLSIAAASILAKVYRDELMEKLDGEFPGYALASNKGYPTPPHRRALKELGPTRIHRRSYRPVAETLSLPFGEVDTAETSSPA